jgi:transketolase
MATLSQLIHAKAIAIAKLAVCATTAAGSGHPTTALSLAHLIATLMYHTMRWRPEQPRDPGADRLVLSEGHAVPIVYAACADLGVTFCPHGQAKRMTVNDLMTLREINSAIDGHPNPALGFPFFDAATGSLGQGLSVAGGLGCAARIDGIDKAVYCIIGDGESREGQVWEAMDFIRDQRLSNVVAIFNCNELGQSDFVSSQQDWTHLQRKAEAFGWATVVIDGHDPEAILAAVGRRAAVAKEGRALAVIARTVKGWGVPALQAWATMGRRSRRTARRATRSARPAREGAWGILGLAGRNGAWLADSPADGGTDSAVARERAGDVPGSRGRQCQGGEIGRGKENAVAATRLRAGAQSTRRRQRAHRCARRRRQELDLCGGFRQRLS